MHHWLPDHQLGVAATLAHAQTRPVGTFKFEERLAFPTSGPS
jgi:hypothetical protein